MHDIFDIVEPIQTDLPVEVEEVPEVVIEVPEIPADDVPQTEEESGQAIALTDLISTSWDTVAKYQALIVTLDDEEVKNVLQELINNQLDIIAKLQDCIKDSYPAAEVLSEGINDGESLAHKIKRIHDTDEYLWNRHDCDYTWLYDEIRKYLNPGEDEDIVDFEDIIGRMPIDKQKELYTKLVSPYQKEDGHDPYEECYNYSVKLEGLGKSKLSEQYFVSFDKARKYCEHLVKRCKNTRCEAVIRDVDRNIIESYKIKKR